MDQKNRQALDAEVKQWQGDVQVAPKVSKLCKANSGCETCIVYLITEQARCKGTPIDSFFYDSRDYFSRSADDVRGFLGALQHGGEEAGREFLKAWEDKSEASS